MLSLKRTLYLTFNSPFVSQGYTRQTPKRISKFKKLKPLMAYAERSQLYTVLLGGSRTNPSKNRISISIRIQLNLPSVET